VRSGRNNHVVGASSFAEAGDHIRDFRGATGDESNTELGRTLTKGRPDQIKSFGAEVRDNDGARAVAEGKVDVHATHRASADYNDNAP
jgi:hypothetical protein